MFGLKVDVFSPSLEISLGSVNRQDYADIVIGHINKKGFAEEIQGLNVA